jgi:hypothetical protein
MAKKKLAKLPARSAKKSALKPVSGPSKQRVNQMSPGLHCHLVLSLLAIMPFGKALLKKIKSFDVHDHPDDSHPDVIALLLAQPLDEVSLAKVIRLESLPDTSIALVTGYFDGEADLFAPKSLDELLLLPNLEELCWPTAMPSPPLDVKPLLALKKLKRVELRPTAHAVRNGKYGLQKNTEAIAALLAVGFTQKSASVDRVVLTRI